MTAPSETIKTKIDYEGDKVKEMEALREMVQTLSDTNAQLIDEIGQLTSLLTLSQSLLTREQREKFNVLSRKKL